MPNTDTTDRSNYSTIEAGYDMMDDFSIEAACYDGGLPCTTRVEVDNAIIAGRKCRRKALAIAQARWPVGTKVQITVGGQRGCRYTGERLEGTIAKYNQEGNVSRPGATVRFTPTGKTATVNAWYDLTELEHRIEQRGRFAPK
jgi:hypothetical protein